MIIYPAIDLKGGRCVRLRQGRMSEADIYGDDPVAMAHRWIGQGANWLHVVDLDGAISGAPVNHEVIAAILHAVQVKVQVGGGIRTVAQIESYLARGAERVVVGTSAILDAGFIQDALRRFPGRVVVSLDAKAGELYVDGWTRSVGRRVSEVAQELADYGVTQLVLTDIQRDGMLRGLNANGLGEQVTGLPLPVIIAGGVTTIEDIEALKAFSEVNGVIVGKALYTGSLELRAALQSVEV